MALQERQVRLYTDTINIYQPETIADQIMVDGEIMSQHYPAAPTYTAQLCYLESAPEITQGKFFGLINRENTVSILDRLHLPLVNENEVTLIIKNGMVFSLLTDGDPDENDWWLVKGNAAVKNWKANKQVFFCKKVIKPPGIT